MAAWLVDFDRRSKLFRRRVETILDALPVEEMETAPLVVNATRRYLYKIDPAQLVSTVSRLYEELVGPGAEAFAARAREAYAAGTLEGRRVMKTLLDDTRELTAPLREAPFLRRVSYVQARVFEEMKGFNGDAGAQLGKVLLEKLSDGKSIRDTKKALVEQFALTRVRAERIARTELIGALRRGRVDEAQETAEKFGVEVGLMWVSALSPTTRLSHAEMHGKILTPDEVRQFYTEDGNAINCKCAQVEVILKDGKPLQEKLVSQETAKRAAFIDSKEKAR